MARPRTIRLVHEAVLTLVAEGGYPALSMEGIAARAGVSKQTLYSSWPSTAAILFDALLAQSASAAGEVVIPDTGDLAADLETLLLGTIAELTDPAGERMLRAVTAEIQSELPLAADLRARLLEPQLGAVAARLERAGLAADDAEAGAELLFGALFHRWLLRTGRLTPAWAHAHAARTLRALALEPPLVTTQR